MKDYLMRDEAPLTKEQWDKLDEMVVKVAKNKLIGRRVINIYGPLGAGIQSIELDRVNVDNDDGRIGISERKYISIPLLYKDFVISWRDIENTKQMKRPFDYSLVAAATSSLCRAEDEIIFNGSKDNEGLMNASDRLIVKKGNWEEGDTPYIDVSKAIEQLIKADSHDQYALVVSTDLYVKMQRIQEGTGLTVLSRVKELVDGRVYQSPVIEQGKGVVLAIGPQNIDLVIGEDMVTAYMGDENLDHLFRVMESLALRIKRPQSICTIE